jgi:HK97 family phage major capsid protein
MSDLKVITKGLSEFRGEVAELKSQVTAITKAIEKPNYGANTPGKVFATARDPKEEGMWGFKSFGHFLSEVRTAGINKSPTEQLTKSIGGAVQKAVIGANEGIGSEGGFFVPPTFSQELFARVYQDSALLSRTDNYTVTGNTMVFPRSAESSRANGSRYGGVQTYWVAEGGSVTATRPTFGQLSLKLNKLMAFAGITQELIDDAGMAMPTYISRAFTDDINFTISDAIIRGTGAGQPQGLVNSACKISVPKEAGQAAATIVYQNIVNMYARLWSGNREKAVWFINQDVLPQLFSMTLGIGTAGVTVFMPPGGVSGKPYATLMGLPIIEIEQCETLGTEGDIILCDLSHYVTITKGTMAAETSTHFYFDTDQQAFRVTYRLDGKPWWHSAITPYKGTNTQSCVITLATRS